MKRDQTYQVVSRGAVTVEFPNGNVVSYPAGFMFKAHPTNASVTRLLRQNLIRMVTPREVPRFGAVDEASNARPAPPPTPVPSPLQVATQAAKKKTKKTSKKGEE